jgi:hypothetical protein
MVYTVEMGSGAMMYIPSFVKIGSGIQNLIQVDTQMHKDTNRQHSDLINLLLILSDLHSVHPVVCHI